MQTEYKKPVIGFSCGDINGIGTEIVIKMFTDNRLLDYCIPVFFGSNKLVNFYRKTLHDVNFSYQSVKDFSKLAHKQVNVFNCWEEDVVITPGVLNETGGRYAWQSLEAATKALKQGEIQGLVTGPIHKNNIQSEAFRHTGHTPYLKDTFEVKDVAMILAGPQMRVALLTEHVPVKEVAGKITKAAILSKLNILEKSLQVDFDISRPRLAVLGLNPHAGDEGLIGDEEINIIKPAIAEAKNGGMLVFGPFSADAFFARGQYRYFDLVLALYHDQGLIPLKSLSGGDAVNITAGLPIIRTSPDHGTAFDIAGKGLANADSLRAALFMTLDLVKRRHEYASQRSNPLKKMSARLVGNARDEAIEE
jgi:4-hydroxythreonine-4-phosphate dehydrogenase